jgi:virulence-associated protein VagC
VQRLRTKIVTNAEEQLVQLPKGFRVDGEEVEIWRVGDELRLRAPRSAVFADWDEMFAAIDSRKPDLPIDRDQPPMQAERISFD